MNHRHVVALSRSDLEGIRRAQTTLLSPLDHADLEAWQAAAVRAVKEVVGAAAGSFVLPLADGSSAVSEDYPPGPWYEYPRRMEDVLADVWARQVALEAHTERDVWRPVLDELNRSACYHEVKVASGAVNAGGMTALLSGEPSHESCAQLLTHRGPGGAQGDRERAIYSLLFPAFASGCATVARIAPAPAALLGSLDALNVPLLLARLDGRALHRNRALWHLLQEESVGACLERELAGALESLRACGRGLDDAESFLATPWDRNVPISGRCYRIRTTLLRSGGFGLDPLALVAVEPPPRLPHEAGPWAHLFGLTPREAEVALLLARGRSNKAVARALGIRPKTARRHTERVLHKLDVRSRAEVASRLLSASLP